MGSRVLDSMLYACLASAPATVSPLSPLIFPLILSFIPLYLFSVSVDVGVTDILHMCICMFTRWLPLHMCARGYGGLSLTPSVSLYCSLLYLVRKGFPAGHRSCLSTRQLASEDYLCSTCKVLESQAATTPAWILCRCWVPWPQPPRGQKALYLQTQLPRYFLVF